MNRAPFITFEGIEGAGKTTLALWLAERLKEARIPHLFTYEPGGSEIGYALRPLLLNAPLEPATELFLFLADRAQHVARTIRPALEQGTWVLCDRYIDSTLAYQGYARGLDLHWLRILNQLATDGLEPDLTVLIDAPVEVALRRATQRNRFEAQDVAFHEAVRQGYLQESKRAPQRFLVLDGTQPLSVLQEQLITELQARWGLWQAGRRDR
ncbi:MAG: dTMP kinase [Fimbriimonadales bacterium]